MPVALDPKPRADAARDKLLRLASKRVESDQSSLCSLIRGRLWEVALDQWLVPEDMSFGSTTPQWDELEEAERRALNHWTYALTYLRIRTGEGYVRNANGVVAEFLRPHAPTVSLLLQRESAEEEDHVEAFRQASEVVLEGLGLGGWQWQTKRGHSLASSTRTTATLLRTFGSDYVVAYFLARGIANHMGKGFEGPIARSSEVCPVLRELTLHHTLDESHHMAVSGLIAAACTSLVPAPSRTRGAFYQRAQRTLSRGIVRYTFGATAYKAPAKRLSLQALARMPALANRTPAFKQALVDAHFSSESGLERARNRVLPKLNARLIDGAALSDRDRQLWRDQLTADQGTQRFL